MSSRRRPTRTGRSPYTLVGLAIMAVLVLGLAACGGDGETDSPDGTTEPTGDVETTGPNEAAELEGTIVAWDWHYGDLSDGTWGAGYQQLDEMFLAMHPGVEIEHVGHPFETYEDGMRAAMAGGNAPDAAMFLPSSNLLNFTDGLVQLDDYITPDMMEDMSGWADTSEGGDPDNPTWALPQGFSGNVWYYNKELFADAGLDPDNPPTTFDELVEAAEALQESGVIPIAGGNLEGFVSAWAWSMTWPGNGTNEEAIALREGGIDWDHPAVIATTEQMVTLFHDYWDPDYASAPLFEGDSIDRFKRGEAAIHAGLSSGPDASYVEFGDALGEENLGVMHPTGASEPNYVPFGASHTWAITGQAEDPDLVWEYIKFVTGAEGAQVLLDEAGSLPHHSAVTLPDDMPEQITRFNEGIDRWGAAHPPHGLMGPQIQEFVPQFQRLLAGECEIAECYQAIQQVRDEELAD